MQRSLTKEEQMKKLLLSVVVLMMAAMPLYGQSDWVEVEGPNWTFDSLVATETDTPSVSGAHAIAWGGDGRFWVSTYGNGIRVINPDGSMADFSPIMEVTIADTAYSTENGRGLDVLPDGNIVAGVSNMILKFNASTGELMGYYETPHVAVASPAVDASGYIYVGDVIGTSPVQVLESDLTYVQDITLTGAPGVTRDILVSADGLSLWAGNSSNAAPAYNWTSTDYVNYSLADSLLTNASGDTIFPYMPIYLNYGPDSTLWVSNNDYYGAAGPAGVVANCLVNFNFETNEYYKVFMPDTAEVNKGTWYYNGPRGSVFSEDGNTMYVASDNMGYIYKYTKEPTLPPGPWEKIAGPDWGFTGLVAAETDTPSVSGAHAIAIGGDGRFWVSTYGNGIRVVNKDGSMADFSPIMEVTIADTAYSTQYGRGLDVLPDGNIVAGVSNMILKFNASTGELMGYYETPHVAVASPAVDASGYVYVGDVIGTSPVQVLESDLTYVQDITLTGAPGVTRDILTSADGLTLWAGNSTNGAPVYKWTSTDYVNYSLSDSLYADQNGYPLFEYMPIYLNYGPDSTLWVSHNDYYGAAGPAGVVDNSIMNFNLATNEYYEVFMPDTAVVNKGTWYYNGPRGSVFSEDGNTMYVASDNMGYIYIYERGEVGIEEPIAEVPRAFQLNQNYPNPFNPTTTISFKLNKPMEISLKVYDVRGRLVKELMDGHLNAGQHQVVFDGSNLSSGVYYYRLQTPKQSVAKEMILVK